MLAMAKKKKKLKFQLKLDKRASKSLLIVSGIVLVGALLFNLRSLFLVAMVNGRPISRFAFDRQLEKQIGKSALEGQISEKLISQAAKKNKIKITQDEIDKKVKEIEDQFKGQGRKLDDLLKAQGQTRKDLEKQLRLQLIVEKILGKDVKVSDKEVADYFQKNKKFFAKDATLDKMKDNLKKQIYQQKISEKFQPWLQKLKKEAKIHYFLKF